MEEALALANVICANAPLAVRTSKELMKRSLDLTEDEAWKLNAELTVPVFTSNDALEGAVAFAEKRPPVTGRDPKLSAAAARPGSSLDARCWSVCHVSSESPTRT